MAPLLPAMSAAAAPSCPSEGKVRVCVPSDFDWSSVANLDLPDNLIFEDSGYFSGSLTQSDADYVERLELTHSQDEDGRPLEGAFVITSPVHLTKSRRRADTTARMIMMIPFQGSRGTAANHHVWLGWRVLTL